MRIKIGLAVIVAAAATAAGCDIWRAAHRATGNSTEERATVEEVLQANADDFRFIAYVVNWHGTRVVVSDPLARTAHRKGDEIQFLAIRVKVPTAVNLKTLSFTIVDAAP